MKLSDMKAGMKIKAVADCFECWTAGEVFEVHEEVSEEGHHAPLLYIGCHHNGGAQHMLDGMLEADGDDIPEFEPMEQPDPRDDLVAALTRLLTHYDSVARDSGMDPDQQDVVRQAKAALAKATP